MATNFISIPLRLTEDADLDKYLRSSLEAEAHLPAQAYTRDIDAITAQRAICISPSRTENSLFQLQKYYVQLCQLFIKIAPEIDGAVFVWHGTLGYSVSNAVHYNSLDFERTNILFNIAALYSGLADACGQDSTTQLKKTSQQFQYAAGCFGLVKQLLLPMVGVAPTTDGMDMSTITTLEFMCLAQAQECFWKTAVLEGMKDATVARLASQASDYFRIALADAMKSPVLRSDWIHYLTCKRFHFDSIANYRMSLDCLNRRRYGQEVSRLRVADASCDRAVACSKYLGESARTALHALQRKIKSDLTRAERDNDMIYLQPVPAESELAPISKAPMVKPQVPEELAHYEKYLGSGELFGPPLFANLLPYAIMKAAAVYADQRDNYVQHTIFDKLDKLLASLHEFLEAHSLPGLFLAQQFPVGLPLALREHADIVRSRGGIESLNRSSKDVAKLALNAERCLNECADLLSIESSEDSALQSKYGSLRWNRLSSDIAGKSLREKGAELQGYIATAKRSDELVSQKIRDASEGINLLTLPDDEIESLIPNSPRDNYAPNVKEILDRLETLVDRTKNFENNIQQVKSDIRDKCEQDSILPQLKARLSELSESITAQQNLESDVLQPIIDKELQKYDQDKKSRVFGAQETLRQLESEISASFKDYQSHQQINQQHTSPRRVFIQKLETGYHRFTEIASNLDEGKRFYIQLLQQLNPYRDKCRDYVVERRTEAANLEQAMMGGGDMQVPKEYNTSAADTASSNNSNNSNKPPPPPPENPTTTSTATRPSVWDPKYGIKFS